MKIQIDLDEQTWASFKAKVSEQGKTLREVVPTVFEPAIRNYLNPEISPSVVLNRPTSENTNPGLPDTPSMVNMGSDNSPNHLLKSCDLCGKEVERRFHSNGKRVCYECWKGTLTAQ